MPGPKPGFRSRLPGKLKSVIAREMIGAGLEMAWRAQACAG